MNNEIWKKILYSIFGIVAVISGMKVILKGYFYYHGVYITYEQSRYIVGISLIVIGLLSFIISYRIKSIK